MPQMLPSVAWDALLFSATNKPFGRIVCTGAGFCNGGSKACDANTNGNAEAQMKPCSFEPE